MDLEITSEYCLKIKEKVHQEAINILNRDFLRYKDQAPSKDTTDITISEIAASVSDEVSTLVTKLIGDLGDIFFCSSDT